MYQYQLRNLMSLNQKLGCTFKYFLNYDMISLIEYRSMKKPKVKEMFRKLWCYLSLLLFFLFLILSFPQTVGFFYPGNCLSFTLLHPFPSFFPLTIRLDNFFFSLPFFLDFREMPFKVVEFI